MGHQSSHSTNIKFRTVKMLCFQKQSGRRFYTVTDATNIVGLLRARQPIRHTKPPREFTEHKIDTKYVYYCLKQRMLSVFQRYKYTNNEPELEKENEGLLRTMLWHHL